MVVYKVKLNGKYVVNYNWKNPLDTSLWILCDECVNTFTLEEFRKVFLPHLNEIEFEIKGL